MYNIKDFYVGRTVVMVRRGYDNDIHKRELDKFKEVVVIRKGSRYVTADSNTPFIFDVRNDFKIDNGRGKIAYGLYLCEQDYFDELEKADLLKEVRSFFNTYDRKTHENISLKDLREISKIIRVEGLIDESTNSL
jgi:hypothetical protein